MSPRKKLSPLQETEARRIAAAEAKANKKERTFSDEEKEKWMAPAAEVTDEWKSKMAKIGVDADGFIADFERIRDRYRAEVKEKGYPWER